MPSKFINGCNTLLGDENLLHFQNNCQEVLSLDDMLNKQFRTDAHFTCYNLIGFPQWPLLNKSILPEIRGEGLDIVHAYMAFDWDNDGHDHQEWSEESLEGFISLVASCTDPLLSSWSAIYTTQHGARIIYTLSHTIPVDVAEQHIAWMFFHFKEKGFPITSHRSPGVGGYFDEGCKDWTRRFRCPQVVRDGKPTWEQTYYSAVTQDAVLDMSLVGKRPTKTVARKTYFAKEKQERPDFAALEGLLYSKDRTTSRYKQTDYYKRAKRLFKCSIYLDMLFNDAAPIWEQGQRNNEIVKMLGSIVPPLLTKASATIQQVFALAIHPLLTLENDQDWVAHGWNALLDIYEREVNKFNLEKEETAKRVSNEIGILDRMSEGMKTWCVGDKMGADEEKDRELVRNNCMASVQGYVYMMDEDGRYTDFAVHRDQIVSRIRRTFLENIVHTTKMNYNGEEVDLSAAGIMNQYSTPVAEVQMRPVGGLGGYVEDMNGEKPVLVLSTFCRNDDLEPTYNPFVNEWLEHLFGDHYATGCAWIGNALAFEEGLICALSLEGASSAGKKLLTEGLSECLKTPYTAGPEAMYHHSSDFLKTPFLIVNEAWPNIVGSTSAADKFKSITGGDGIIVNEKFKPAVKVLCPVRLIMTANDDRIIKELIGGKDMGLNNRIAIGDRLYHLKVSYKAKWYLESIGGRGFTAKTGQRWIRADSGADKSDFIIAKHFLWLYKHRDYVDPAQRFLIMGNCSPGTGTGHNIVENLLATNNHTPITAGAILALLDNNQAVWTQYIRTDDKFTRIWVTRYGVHKYAKDVMEERVTESEVYSGMLNLMENTDPDIFDKVHWYEISVESLVNIATTQGISKTRARTMLLNKISLKQETVT